MKDLRRAARLRIGLISDTHIPEARAELWPQVFDAFAGVDLILHAGDVHHASVVEQLGTVAPTYIARGNGDDGGAGRPVLPEHEQLRRAWYLELGGLRVGVIHSLPIPESPPRYTVARTLDRHLPGQDLDVVIYGGSHVETIETIDGVLCVNPGSPTYPHNYDTQLGTIGFLEIEEGEARASIWRLVEDGIEPYDWKAWRR